MLKPGFLVCLLLCLLGWGNTYADAPSKARGWRYDGSGVFPVREAPVLGTESAKLVWKKVLVEPSNGSPVVYGDRVYIVSEPTELQALDLRTAKLLWKRQNNYMDTYKGDELADAKKKALEAEKLRKELDSRKKELYRMKRRLRGSTPSAGLADAVKALEKRVNEMHKKYDQTWRVRQLPPIELIGYSSGTPLVDESGIYVGFGNGVFSRFDFDGTRRWSVGFGDPPGMMRGYNKGHSASPILIGNRLIVGYQKLRALDKDSGAVAWEGDIFLDYGTPVPMRLGEEDLVVTPQGEVYRLSDGEQLADDLGDVWHCGPVVDGNVLYFVGSGLGRIGAKGKAADASKSKGKARAIRLSMEGGELRHETLWESPVEPGDYYASPVLYGGILYSISIAGVLVAMDSRTGKTHYRKVLEPLGRVFASPAIAGDLLHIFGPSGKTWSIRTGPKGEILSEGQLGQELDFRVWSSPFFHGSSLFVREREHLYRFGK